MCALVSLRKDCRTGSKDPQIACLKRDLQRLDIYRRKGLGCHFHQSIDSDSLARVGFLLQGGMGKACLLARLAQF